MAENSQKYVGFLEAIRIVMRIQQADWREADLASDDWLRDALYRYHGGDTLHMAALAARNRAVEFLRDVLPKGFITGTAPTGTGRRNVTPYEWANYHIDFSKGCLSNKSGTKQADFPRIDGIDVSVEDLRRELSNLGYDSHEPKNSHEKKRHAIKQAIKSLDRKALEPLTQKERVAKIIAQAKIENGGLSVSERLVRDGWFCKF